LLGYYILYFFLTLILAGIIGLITVWIDRKVTARVQYRVGPPPLQPVYDVFKLLSKEVVVPETAKKTGFLLAPIIGFCGAALACYFVIMSGMPGYKGFNGDILVIIYLLTLPSLSIIIGGLSSGNPVAALGASREMKLILAYELPFILAISAVFIICPCNNLTLSGLVLSAGVSKIGAFFVCLLGFIVGLLCIQAKLGFVPFDCAEAETEIMSGPFIEYSGAPLAMFKLTKALLYFVLPTFLVFVFMGGIKFTLWGTIWFFVRYLIVVVLIVLIKNTNPRVRIDQAVSFFWKKLGLVSLISVILAVVAR